MKKYLTTMALLIIVVVTFSACGSSDDEAVNTNEISIAILRGNAFIETAARRFEEIHDHRYSVNIIIYEDFASYSQIINTAIMSGMGEDIIHASNLAWERIADAGRLVDLNNTLTFAQGEFYQSVLDAFLHNGSRYVIPLSFHIETFSIGDMATTGVNSNRFSFADFMALASAYPEAHLITSPMGMSETTLAHRFFSLNFDEFIDMTNRRANVDNENFISLLEDVKSIAERLHQPEHWQDPLILSDMFFNPAMASSGMPDYSNFHIKTNDQGNGMVSAFDLLAINANSQNRELASRFIQFLISEEMQTSPEIWQTAVNRNAAQLNAIALYESIRATEDSVIPQEFNLDTNIAVFNRLADRLTIAPTSDPFINDFVRNEMDRFFNGEVTAPQAAQNLQARLTTYLNE